MTSDPLTTLRPGHEIETCSGPTRIVVKGWNVVWVTPNNTVEYWNFDDDGRMNWHHFGDYDNKEGAIKAMWVAYQMNMWSIRE